MTKNARIKPMGTVGIRKFASSATLIASATLIIGATLMLHLWGVGSQTNIRGHKVAKKTKGAMIKRANDVYYLRYKVEGKTTWVSLGTKDVEEAEKVFKLKVDEHLGFRKSRDLDELQTKIATEKKFIKGNSILLDDVWSLFLSAPNRSQPSEGTLNNILRDWTRFRLWMSEHHSKVVDLKIISQDIIKQWMAEDLTGIAPTTRKDIINRVRQVVVEVFPESTVFAFYKHPKITDKDVQHKQGFTKEQIKEIFKTLDDDTFTLELRSTEDLKVVKDDMRDYKNQFRILCAVTCHTGMRLIDAATISWDEVNLTQSTVSYIPEKTRRTVRTATIPIPSSLVKMFKSIKKDGKHILPRIASKYLRDPDGVVTELHNILEKNGLKVRTEFEGKRNKSIYGWHSFRHYFATAHAENGTNRYILAQMLGDDPATMEKYYIHISDTASKEAMRKMPKFKI